MLPGLKNKNLKQNNMSELISRLQTDLQYHSLYKQFYFSAVNNLQQHKQDDQPIILLVDRPHPALPLFSVQMPPESPDYQIIIDAIIQLFKYHQAMYSQIWADLDAAKRATGENAALSAQATMGYPEKEAGQNSSSQGLVGHP